MIDDIFIEQVYIVNMDSTQLTINQIVELQKIAKELRRKSLEIIHRAGSGHPGGSLSAADIVTALYFGIMKYDPKKPEWEDRDRFILSKGHAALALYCTLFEKGFISLKTLRSYGKDNTVLMGHASHKVNGVEFSTGSLGHGLLIAVGKSLKFKINAEFVGHPAVQNFSLKKDRKSLFALLEMPDNGEIIISLLPGSRASEVKKILPIFGVFFLIFWGWPLLQPMEHPILVRTRLLESCRPLLSIVLLLHQRRKEWLDNLDEYVANEGNDLRADPCQQQISHRSIPQGDDVLSSNYLGSQPLLHLL